MSNSIFGIFAKSPIKPVEQCADLTAANCEALTALFAQQATQGAAVIDDILARHQQARAIKNEILSHLPRSLFMPFERADLIGIVLGLEQIQARIKAIAIHVQGRQLGVDASMQTAFADYLQLTQSAMRQTQQVINELDELLEAGFAGREAAKVEQMIAVINGIDEQADGAKLTLFKQLHKLEAAAPDRHDLITYRLVDWLGDIIEGTQRIAAHLLLMLAKA